MYTAKPFLLETEPGNVYDIKRGFVWLLTISAHFRKAAGFECRIRNDKLTNPGRGYLLAFCSFGSYKYMTPYAYIFFFGCSSAVENAFPGREIKSV